MTFIFLGSIPGSEPIYLTKENYSRVSKLAVQIQCLWLYRSLQYAHHDYLHLCFFSSILSILTINTYSDLFRPMKTNYITNSNSNHTY